VFSDSSGKAEGVSAPGWIYLCSFMPQKKSEERGHKDRWKKDEELHLGFPQSLWLL